jgi:hypothetical protein
MGDRHPNEVGHDQQRKKGERAPTPDAFQQMEPVCRDIVIGGKGQ